MTRVKLKRGASPAPSHVSMKSDRSMDPPGNFLGGTTQHMTSITLKRGVSPAPSHVSMKSDRSMDPPGNFLGGTTQDMTSIKLKRGVSPAPSYVSMKSDRLMDPPGNFLGGTTQNSDMLRTLLTEDHFRCSMCTDVLKDPVSIPCGHSYCRQCITSHWALPNHAGLYACPQCAQTYSSCPALYTNSALAVVVQKLQHFSPVPPDQHYAGPGDVACDFCTGRKLRAVKSCLTCSASYCEPHIRHHYTVPALKKHTMVEPEHQVEKPKEQCDIKTEDFKSPIPVLQSEEEQMICSQHNKKREYFCKTDTIFICSLCTTEAHSGHDIKTEDMSQANVEICENQKIDMPDDDKKADNYKIKIQTIILEDTNLMVKNATLEACESELRRMNAELETTNAKLIAKNAILEARESRLIGMYAELETNNSNLMVKNFTIEACESELRRMNAELETKKSELKEELSRLETKNSRLQEEYNTKETENSELIEENGELDMKNSKLTKKNIKLEKKYLKLREENMELKTEHAQLEQNVDQLKNQNAELQEQNTELQAQNLQLQKDTNEQKEEIDSVLDINTMLEKNILGPFQGSALPANVILDPDTAHSQLTLSNDGKSFKLGITGPVTIPDNPRRFDYWFFVLGKEGFSSGRHFWQVVVNTSCIIGVTKDSAKRKGDFQFCPELGYWLLRCKQLESEFFAWTYPLTTCSVRSGLLNVCLDVGERWVSFHNANWEHIYTFRKMDFSKGEKIYPVFYNMDINENLLIKSVPYIEMEFNEESE
ncbi:uncharacterized protein LOC143106698 [Alosa pseudoharengus]|uniref:uncharacterized protein LOC143106698 n=1 Tax=Alosa pseudoharengus TaxID=34774 RepID=UPI003F89C017